jgi:hypothetical protein
MPPTRLRRAKRGNLKLNHGTALSRKGEFENYCKNPL